MQVQGSMQVEPDHCNVPTVPSAKLGALFCIMQPVSSFFPIQVGVVSKQASTSAVDACIEGSCELAEPHAVGIGTLKGDF